MALAEWGGGYNGPSEYYLIYQTELSKESEDSTRIIEVHNWVIADPQGIIYAI